MIALRRFGCVFALVGVSALKVAASPICCDPEAGLPLAQQFDRAEIVLMGHFENAKASKDGIEAGHSEFVIERRYKDHSLIRGVNRINMNLFVNDPKRKFIVFCDVFNGKLDPYKGTYVEDAGEMIKYLEKISQLKNKPQPERLRNAFDFLNSPEIEVSSDAYREFAKSDYNDYKEMAKTLPAKTLAGWLRDKKTPPYRFGLYAMLLGHCGDQDDAKFLMEMINDPERRKGSGVHGFMMAYTMLEPVKGWKFINDVVPDKKHGFVFRFAGLQTIRFLYEIRPDIINKDETAAKKEIIKGVVGILDVADLADFAIEDLRKWHRWDTCSQVLGLFGKKTHDTPIIRKAILRYALMCPDPPAKAFVKTQEARDREWVEETRELLELERTPAPVTPTSKK